MKTQKVFYNKRNYRKSSETTIVINALNGRYGYYARYRGYNASLKNLQEFGFELVDMTDDEISKIQKLEQKRKRRISKQILLQKLNDRQKQVEICLNAEPLKIENGLVSIAKSKMAEVYHGCGKGTAYVNENNELVAFHYGYNVAPKTPANCTSHRVDLSCYEIIF